jgi:hypothetical protein
LEGDFLDNGKMPQYFLATAKAQRAPIVVLRVARDYDEVII